MSRRRINNHFKKWLVKGLPFFLIVFFLFFNVPFFFFNGSLFERKNGGSHPASLRKTSNQPTFDLAISFRERKIIEDELELHRIETGDYPAKIEGAIPASKVKNWVYIKSTDRYMLEYKRLNRP